MSTSNVILGGCFAFIAGCAGVIVSIALPDWARIHFESNFFNISRSFNLTGNNRTDVFASILRSFNVTINNNTEINEIVSFGLFYQITENGQGNQVYKLGVLSSCKWPCGSSWESSMKLIRPALFVAVMCCVFQIVFRARLFIANSSFDPQTLLRSSFTELVGGSSMVFGAIVQWITWMAFPDKYGVVTTGISPIFSLISGILLLLGAASLMLESKNMQTQVTQMNGTTIPPPVPGSIYAYPTNPAQPPITAYGPPPPPSYQQATHPQTPKKGFGFVQSSHAYATTTPYFNSNISNANYPRQ